MSVDTHLEQPNLIVVAECMVEESEARRDPFTYDDAYKALWVLANVPEAKGISAHAAAYVFRGARELGFVGD
ncbi:MAG: hypothetical protein ABSG93_18960 [Solirubrobacteraceae bacterium]|jgi:hypothetical protein